MNEPSSRTEEEKAAEEEEKAAERARLYAFFYAKLHAPPEPPVDAARKFLHSYFVDDSWEEARERITSLAAHNTRSILAGLAEIEALLADPPTGPYVLQNLVWWEAQREEEGLTEAGATAWLREVAEMVRDVLGDKQPPRLGAEAPAGNAGE